MFQWLMKTGNVPLDDMRRTFNMGVGMIMVVDPSKVWIQCGGYEKGCRVFLRLG